MKTFLLLIFLSYSCLVSIAWVVHVPATTGRTTATRNVQSNQRSCRTISTSSSTITALSASSRRTFVATTVTGTAIGLLTTTLPANALVKGNAPPPPKSKSSASSDKPKCRNVEECQAEAERKEALEREEALKDYVPPSSTASGVKYRDIQLGTGSTVAKTGDEVTLYYKVLKLGKRSYDGLSGEGTVVFSRGFGLEDDEKKAGDRTFVTVLGALNNVEALNEAVPGMKVGGTRRIRVLPEQGWRKPGQACDGGPGGRGSGGELRTDYVVVPTATMVAEEACFDQGKQPFPATYAQQRRMAQRFDQSLILEVELVAAGPPTEF